jgi:hypothetical protein
VDKPEEYRAPFAPAVNPVIAVSHLERPRQLPDTSSLRECPRHRPRPSNDQNLWMVLGGVM